MNNTLHRASAGELRGMSRRFVSLVTILLILFTMLPGKSSASANITLLTPTDRDGDGVLNWLDNCEFVYNPMHNPFQPLPAYPLPQWDFDNDGLGNACDPDFFGEHEPSNDPEYQWWMAGLGLYFVDFEGHVLNTTESITFQVTYISDRPQDLWTVDQGYVHLNVDPPYWPYWNSPFLDHLPSQDGLARAIRFDFSFGGSYTHTLHHNLFEMVAINPAGQPVQPALWDDLDDDGDGVNNGVDKCISQPGPAENQGCPLEDRDGDGISDGLDQCPDEYALTPNGCPATCTDYEFLSESWKGLVRSGVTENHLYTFMSSVRYCYSDNYAEILKADGQGFVDAGVDEAILDLFGFTPTYQQEMTDFSLSEDRQTVNIYTQFDMCWDVTVLIDKFKIKDKLSDKAENWLAKRIAQQISKYGDLTGPKASKEILAFVDELGDNLILHTTTNIEKSIPYPLSGVINDRVVSWMEEKKAVWENEIQQALASGEYTNMTANEIAKAMLSKIRFNLEAFTSLCFSVWEPIHIVTVSPGGEVTSNLYNRFINPFMIVEKVESQ